MDLLCFCSILWLLCFCASVLCALWSPAWKGLTSWLSFVVSNCEFVTFPLVSWVRCGTWLYRFLSFAPLLTKIIQTADMVFNWRVGCNGWLSVHYILDCGPCEFTSALSCYIVSIILFMLNLCMYCRANQEWQWSLLCLQLLSITLICTHHLSLHETIDHLCINPILRIGLIHKWSIDYESLILFKQNMTSLSLLAGRTVEDVRIIKMWYKTPFLKCFVNHSGGYLIELGRSKTTLA